LADKLRVGVIGCGGMTRNHTYGYLNSGRFEIVGLADLSEQAMKEYDDHFAEREDYKAKHFTDFRAMLAESKPEVVSIGVWHKGHSPMTIAAAASEGVKAVLCEKPMADSLAAAREMLTVCERNNVKLVIGHQRRFLPAYTLAKQMIEDGEIGDVESLRIYRVHGPVYCPPVQPGENELVFQLQHAGSFSWVCSGFFIDWHCHNIDVACWTKGAWPISAQGMGGRCYEQAGNQFDH